PLHEHREPGRLRGARRRGGQPRGRRPPDGGPGRRRRPRAHAPAPRRPAPDEHPERRDTAMTANPWVRPYVLTGGRTRTRYHLYVHTLVSVQRYDPAASVRLSPEARRLYERASFGAQSVAELSAHCGVSLGVAR